jgi:hypothetical protein
MSQARHVAAKDELLALMVDAALSQPPPSIAAGADWRDGLTRWASAYREILREHS